VSRAPVRAVAILCAVSIVACKTAPSPATSKTEQSAPPAPTVPPSGLEFVEMLAGGGHAGDRLPLVVALHGLGDRPESFLSLFRELPVPARIVAPHSETRFSDGFAWFPPNDQQSDATADAIANMASRIARFAVERAHGKPSLGKPIVVGFSQGGALTLEIAVHHADDVAAAFPIGGWMGPKRLPTEHVALVVPIHAFHGTGDTRVPFATSKNALQVIERAGFPVTFHEYPGVGHEITNEERAQFLDELAAACERQRGGQ
jgi:phospholipase/carboxylesterase